MLTNLKNIFYRPLLKSRLLSLVVLTVILPMIVITVSIGVYYYLGIESVFNKKIKGSINNSVEIAEHYLHENKEKVKSDILAITYGIIINRAELDDSSENWWDFFLQKHLELRDLSEAIVFTEEEIIGKSLLSFSLPFHLIKKYNSHIDSKKNNIYISENSNGDLVTAISKLPDFKKPTYLLVSRFVDKKILQHRSDAIGSAKQYKHLMEDILRTRNKVLLIIVIVFCLISSFAILLALKISNSILNPINNLISAISKIQKGNLKHPVSLPASKNEIYILSKAFNEMIKALKLSQENLQKRGKFIEVVIEGIPSSLIVLDKGDKIILCNYLAKQVLNLDNNIYNKHYSIVLQEIEDLLLESKKKLDVILEKEVSVKIKNNKRYLFFRIISDSEQSIISFLDMTSLVVAQKAAAWSNIAKKIAHEIKNPLTPMSLIVKRLKKKELKEKDINKYLNIFSVQIASISRIVEDFVKFSAIGEPQFKKENICELIDSVITMQQTLHDKINYKFNSKYKNILITCDKSQITQLIINLLKNSAEAILVGIEKKLIEQGEIVITLKKLDHSVKINITNNGETISIHLENDVLKENVTTKKHGKGIGLSIVQRIIKQHNGKFKIYSKNGITYSIFELMYEI